MSRCIADSGTIPFVSLFPGEKRSEEQVEAMLVRVVEMFNYLTDKDVFAECYRLVVRVVITSSD